MKYKYKKGQVFGKRLQVPKAVLYDVYHNTLTFNDFITYDLVDKIPISCIIKSDRRIVERFGIEKSKDLDWELINKRIFYNPGLTIRETLMTINENTQDINTALYELVKDQIEPNDYSSKMKERYQDRLFDINQEQDTATKAIKNDFNHGTLTLKDFVKNWDLFKGKDLSYCLLHDRINTNHIKNSELKQFMNDYKDLSQILIRHNKNIYTFINGINNMTTDEEKKEYIKQTTDEILNTNDIGLITSKEYMEIFKYSSLEEYLNKFSWDSNYVNRIIAELKNLPPNYIFNMPIPFSELKNYDVLTFLGNYGIKNVVDFDNECGHFFTRNNCEMLRQMNELYLRYVNYVDPEKTVFTIKRSEHDNSNRPYTKDEFYEAIRRMIVYGPTGGNYMGRAPDYRNITGDFRKKYNDLFISEQAPEELQDLFYTRSLTPKILQQHSEYVKYLQEKPLKTCFKKADIKVEGSAKAYGIENIYDFLSNKIEYEKQLPFIIDYGEILDIISKENINSAYQYEIPFSINDNIQQIQQKIGNILRKILIEKRIPYPTNIPKNLIQNNPSMFLDNKAPKELKQAFYNRTINTEFILSNPTYKNYLKNIDFEMLFPYMLVSEGVGQVNFINYIKNILGQEESLNLMHSYGKYIEKIYEINKLHNLHLNSAFSKEDLLNELEKTIVQEIIMENLKYDESLPKHFKNHFPTLFLDENTPQEIRNKFYNQEFSPADFKENQELLQYFNKTNIAFGLEEHRQFLIGLYPDVDIEEGNRRKLYIYDKLQKIKTDKETLETVKDYIKYHEYNEKKIDTITKLAERAVHSNSTDIRNLSGPILASIVNLENPEQSFEKIEDIFTKNNLPFFAKIYSCFELLNPELKAFDFSNDSRVAPELKEETLPKIGLRLTKTETRFQIIFNDILRITYSSNNRDFQNYLNNLEFGNSCYNKIKEENFNLSSLTEKEQKELLTFSEHLEALSRNIPRKDRIEFNLDTLSLEDKIKILGDSFSPTDKYQLKDRIIRSFCYYAGITSFEELKSLSTSIHKQAEEKGRKNARRLEEHPFQFEVGDFVRGIGFYNILGSTLQHGNVCKEFLTTFIKQRYKSDTTSLDIDLTYVTEQKDIYHTISGSPTGFNFGNIFIILKHDNPNINITRDEEGNLTGRPYNPKKMEVFGTKTSKGGFTTHWGIRTGISFSDVDYILYKKDAIIDEKNPYDKNGNVQYISTESEEKFDDLSAIKFEIARNGIYIPVIDFSGKLIYTEEEYDDLRSKMQGLSYYGTERYSLSDNLISDEIVQIAETIATSNQDNKRKQDAIKATIIDALAPLGITIKDKIDHKLETGTAEFIDTGSTGRNTNILGKGDFDFIMRLDNSIMSDEKKLQELKERLLKVLGEEHRNETVNGNFRFKNVHIEGIENPIELDISFVQKTDKLDYSSDESIRDRLTSIKKQYPDEYNLVLANIIEAKKVLKDGEAYKKQQGGMGGIGIENWILQNGGSLQDAATSFIEASKGKSLKEFKNTYPIWDFGENHYADEKEIYPHDNFTSKLTEKGYERMKQTLSKYLENTKQKQELGTMLNQSTKANTISQLSTITK